MWEQRPKVRQDDRSRLVQHRQDPPEHIFRDPPNRLGLWLVRATLTGKSDSLVNLRVMSASRDPRVSKMCAILERNSKFCKWQSLAGQFDSTRQDPLN